MSLLPRFVLFALQKMLTASSSSWWKIRPHFDDTQKRERLSFFILKERQWKEGSTNVETEQENSF